MESNLIIPIEPQPDDTTCGPTCLQAIYRYHGDAIPLAQVIDEAPKLSGGGTLAALLGCHALARGYGARLFTFNLRVFDPTWFSTEGVSLQKKLEEQLEIKPSRRIREASRAYMRFLDLGGKIRFEDLTAGLIRHILKQDTPILAGLSATYLYRTARERDEGGRLVFDDLRGEPSGHFVVLSGYDMDRRTALIADPLLPNPMSQGQHYEVKLNHLACAVMLGILTFDANLLVIEPRKAGRAACRPGRA